MIPQTAIPVLKEFMYFPSKTDYMFIADYSKNNHYITQEIGLDIINKCKNQNDLRKILFNLYNECIQERDEKWI